jgi:hypothetical protein
VNTADSPVALLKEPAGDTVIDVEPLTQKKPAVQTSCVVVLGQ